MDDSDVEDSESDGDDDNGMVLDEEENGSAAQEGHNDLYYDDDHASLNLRDSEEETEVDSMMMVSFDMERHDL